MTPLRRSSRSLTLKEAVDAGLRLLSHRPRSEWEVRHRLSRRFSSELVESAVTNLKDRDLLDDSAFARFWCESRERHRPRATFVLRWELRQKGVDSGVINEALEAVDDEENAYRAALRSMPADHSAVDPSALRRKIMAHLGRRGFGLGPASRAVASLLEQLPDSDHRRVVGKGEQQQEEDVESLDH